VHDVNEAGQVVLRRRLRRSDVLRLFTEIDASFVGHTAASLRKHASLEDLIAAGRFGRRLSPHFVTRNRPGKEPQRSHALGN
jgi:hypothetical protein